jgi:hypothetical protein
LVPVVNGPLQATRLNPTLVVQDQRYALHPQLKAAVPARLLSRPIANVVSYYDDIVAAIDMVFLGF